MTTTDQQARHDRANRDTVALLRLHLGCDYCEVCTDARVPGTGCEDRRCVIHTRAESVLEAQS